jgi:predicted nucleic acid-binding protein
MPTNVDCFVDTAGWACYLDRNEELHQQVVTLVQEIALRNRRLITTNCVIAELVALVSSRKQFARPAMITAIDALKASALIEVVYIDESLDAAGWQLLKSRLDKSWSLVDATSFEVMTRFGRTDAITLDHHFSQAGFVRLPLEQR